MSPLHLATRLRLPWTTVRGRLALLYGGLFIACGAALLAITYLFFTRGSHVLRSGPRFFRNLHSPAGAIASGQQAGAGGVSSGQTVKHLITASHGVAQAIAFGIKVRNADLHQLILVSAAALAVMAVVSILLGWLVAGRVLGPLRTITATTRQISEDNLHERLALPGPRDELRDLSDTIDGLLARLDAAFEAQRRFVANASHELRTPLTVSRTLLEMALGDPDATVESFRSICRDVLESGEQQEDLIEALLTLARSQRGLDRRQPLDLAVIATDVTRSHESEAAARGLALELSASSAPMAGDPHLVERLVSNLLENALHHNVPGGRVEVLVETEGERARLEMSNSGPVVPPDQLGRLLQPFQRLAPDRVATGQDGLGLGLSIVAAIAGAHGADLDVRPRDGGGLDVEVRFPSPRPEPTGAPGDENGKLQGRGVHPS